MEQSFLVKVTVDNLKESLDVDMKKTLIEILLFAINRKHGDFYGYFMNMVEQLLDEITIKLEIVKDESEQSG